MNELIAIGGGFATLIICLGRFAFKEQVKHGMAQEDTTPISQRSVPAYYDKEIYAAAVAATARIRAESREDGR